jgi:hypothetical protein
VGVWVQLGPLDTAATNRPTVPAPADYDDGEIGGMIGSGNRSTRRKPPPVSLCPPQTPHAPRTRTRDAAVGSQGLTAWATARPGLNWILIFYISKFKQIRVGLLSLWLYKENKLCNWKKKTQLLYIFSLWAPHTYDFVVVTSLTHPRKIILFVL